MSATFKRSPASSCSRESIASYRHPNAFDGVDFIRQNARTVESASAKGYCLSSQTTIESRHSQQKRSLPGHLPKPFCKQFLPEKSSNTGKVDHVLEGILLKVEGFRELDKDRVKDRLRDMTSIFIGKEGGLVFDFIEEENKVVLKYLIYILYDTLLNHQNTEKPQISQQFLEEELAQKRRQLQDLSDKLASCSQKFNAMRDILEESRKGYEGLVTAMVQGGSDGEESVKRAKSKIRQLQNEFKKISELDKHGICRAPSISKSLPMKDIGNILTQDRYQGKVSQKELSKETSNERENYASSSSSIEANGRYKRKLDGLKNEIGKLESEYENLGIASLTLAEQADRHRKCFDKQLKLCKKLEEQNDQLEEENIALREENTDLRSKNISESMRQGQRERGIMNKNGSQDCLVQSGDGNQFEKRIKYLEQMNQELQQNSEVLRQQNEDFKKRDAYFVEIRELLEEKIKELTSLNDSLERKIVELEKQLVDKQEDNIDLNRELTECLALVEAGKVSIDQLKMTMKDKDGDELTRADKITQRIIHNIQQEQRIIASKLLQSQDLGEELEDQDEIKSLFGEEMLEYLNKMQQTIKDTRNGCQQLQQQILNHANSRIQANQDIIVLASIVLQTHQVLASHSNLPALLEQLKQQLWDQKQSITEKIQETEDDTQNIIQQINKSNTQQQQLQDQQPMDSSRDNELIQALETQNIMPNKNNGSCSRYGSPRNSTFHQSFNGANNNSNYNSQRSNCIPRPSMIENHRKTLSQQQNCLNRRSKQIENNEEYSSMFSENGQSLKNIQIGNNSVSRENEEIMQMLMLQASSIEQLLFNQ